MRLMWLGPDDGDLSRHLLKIIWSDLYNRHPEAVPKPRVYEYRQRTRTGFFERIVIDGIPYMVEDKDLKRFWEIGKPTYVSRPRLSKTRPKYYADGKPANRAAWEELHTRKVFRDARKKRFEDAKKIIAAGKSKNPVITP